MKRRASSGFTLVELLIVIVVIAILAAITIVAYGNVTSKAQAAKLQSDLGQARSFMESYFVQNGQYPADLETAETAGLKFSVPNSQVSYSVNNSSNPQTWGITVTDGSLSYYMNNTSQTTAKSGAWITNLAIDPRATSSGAEYASRYGNSSTWVTGASDGPTAGLTTYVRKTITTAVTSGGRGIDHHGNVDTSSSSDNAIPVTGGTTYYISDYARSSEANSDLIITCKIHDSTGVWLAGSGVTSTLINYTANTWAHPSLSLTAVGDGYLSCSTRFNASIAWAVGDTMDVTGLMVVQGSASSYTYADGSMTSSGWSWNGTANASSSTGPAL